MLQLCMGWLRQTEWGGSLAIHRERCWARTATTVVMEKLRILILSSAAEISERISGALYTCRFNCAGRPTFMCR